MVCLMCRHGHPITPLLHTEESCTYNYSKTLQKNFSLKLIRLQANTTALLTIYQPSNARPARTEILVWDYGLYEMQHWKVKGQAAHAQNSKTLVYKQQQSTTAIRKNKGEKNLWSDEQWHAAMEAVSSGELKAHAAAKQYGIPSSTLHDHIKGKSTKRYGCAPTVLTVQQKKRKR